MLQVLLALIGSLGQSLGGRTGSLVTQLVNTIGTLALDRADVIAFAVPWVQWANAIVDANRDPTDAEEAAANAVADAVHANNQSLAAGGPGVPLPPPPTV